MKRILIITVGATPQVVTETIWALLHRDPPFLIDELVLITTSQGRKLFESTLLGPKGKIGELLAECRLPNDFPTIVHVPTTKSGEEIQDIRTDAEATAFGDMVARIICDYARHAGNILHVSLAGGRKTMSYYAGSALSLFGRAQDELSHVLVAPEDLEQCPDFWWPYATPRKVTHRIRTNKTGGRLQIDTSTASVELASIPFIRLSSDLELQKRLDASELTYEEVIRRGQDTLSARKVIVDCAARSLRIGETEIRLAHREFALYRLLATALKDQWPGCGPDGAGKGHVGWLTVLQIQTGVVLGRKIADIYLEFYEDCFFSQPDQNTERKSEAEQFAERLIGPDFQASNSQTLTRLRNRIRLELRNRVTADKFIVASIDTSVQGARFRRFGLLLDPSAVEIRERDTFRIS